jgi:hypothetical protein
LKFKKVSSTLLVICLFCLSQARANSVFSHDTFLDVNFQATEVQRNLSLCADELGLTLPQLYSDRLSECNSEIQESLKILKDSFKLFTLTSLVDYYGAVANREKISPLLIQIISENISEFKLDETKKGGGKTGLGICAGPISIGICTETNVFEIPPKVTEQHIAFLQLFDLIPASQCDLGFFPSATVTLINEVADAQGLVSNRARNNVVVIGDTMIIGPAAEKYNGFRVNPAFRELILRLQGKYFLSCGLTPGNRSASRFFREFNPNTGTGSYSISPSQNPSINDRN